jgi:predicted component of type VI protein secretion system
VNYLSLYEYIRDISQNIDYSVRFFHGRKDILNLQYEKEPVYVYLLPFQSSGNYTTAQQANETWQVNFMVYQKDQPDTAINQNDPESLQVEMEILTTTEEVVDKIIHYINYPIFPVDDATSEALQAASEFITILNFTKVPAIKDTAQILTGWLVTLNLQVDDSFNYCSA